MTKDINIPLYNIEEDERDVWDEMLDRMEKRYQAKLLRHPDCRDPEHPGCERCKGEES